MRATPRPAGLGRLGVAGLSLGLVLAFAVFDLAASEPVNPFDAPPPAAFGSGLAAGGAHCAAPPAAR